MSKKIEINILSLIFIYYMIFILIGDYASYFISLPYIISTLLSLLLSSIIFVFTRKIWEISNDFSKYDIFFYIFIISIFIITIIYLDRSFDTMNYHLYIQEHPFNNKIFSDFFAGKNLNSFTYAFSDRMFYFIRCLVGYRLGTILNYFAIIIIYFETKKIIKNVLPKNTNVFWYSFFSTLAVLTISILDILDSYYIDLLSLTVIMIIMNLLFFSYNSLNCNKKFNLIFYGLISLLYGFAFVIKISNAPILILLFIAFVIKNKSIFKTLDIVNITSIIILFVIPFGLYMYYTYVSTGNPIFPFYNSIFHSSYYNLSNWMDTRFGPSRLLEVPFWPIIAIINKKRCVDSGIVEPMWMIGYISSIIIILKYIISFIKTKKISNEKVISFALLTFFAYLTWSKFQLGYTRYGLIAILLGSICFYIILYNAFLNKKIILISIISLLMIWNIGYSVFNYAYNRTFWIFNNYFNNHQYKYNLKNIFSNGQINKNYQDKNVVWGILYANSGFAQMIDNNIPIYSLTSGVSNDVTQSIFESGISKYDKIYSPIDTLDFNNFINSLNENKYKIKQNVDAFSSSIIENESSYLYVFEVEKCINTCKSSIKIFNSSTDYTGKDFLIGLSYNMNKQFNNQVYIQIRQGNTLIDKIAIDEDGKMSNVHLNSIEKYTISVVDENDKIINFPWIMIEETEGE